MAGTAARQQAEETAQKLQRLALLAEKAIWGKRRRRWSVISAAWQVV